MWEGHGASAEPTNLCVRLRLLLCYIYGLTYVRPRSMQRAPPQLAEGRSVTGIQQNTVLHAEPKAKPSSSKHVPLLNCRKLYFNFSAVPADEGFAAAATFLLSVSLP
jgi:hypothetical protein